MDDVELAWFNGFYAGFHTHREGKSCRHGYGPGDHHWESGNCVSQDVADDETIFPHTSCVRCGQYGVRDGLDHTPCEPSA